MSEAKFKIYQGILCLETDAANGYTHGRKWWDWGYDLAYTPMKIEDITRYKVGKLIGSPRTVMAVETQEGFVAVNLPRTDIFTLQTLGLYPAEIPQPFTQLTTYAPWIEKL